MPYTTNEAKDMISRGPASAEEIKEIAERLSKTKTKAISAEPCKVTEPPKEPGYGLKMLPAIPGLEERFKGPGVPPEKVEEVTGRLHTTATKASTARKDNHRILLYPERTLLMNNVERIVAFQQTGAIAKQNMLARREKWFN